MQIFLADGRDGTNEPTEGSTRGPRGPKNKRRVDFDDVDASIGHSHRPNEASGPDFVDKVLARLRHTAHTLHPLEPKTASVHCSAALSPTHTSVIKIVVIFISTMTMDLTFYS